MTSSFQKYCVVILAFAMIIFISCNRNKPASPISTTATQPAEVAVTAYKDLKQLPIWPKAIPDSGLVTGEEIYNDGMVLNVSRPTMTIFSPKGKNTGAAVLVFPGGGYNKLAIELEGSEICEWLASIGVTGILLKYRVPASGPHYDKECHCEKDPVKPMALQDAQRTMGMVRLHAKEWNIDPSKIGVMGFSAGGHLVADISTNYEKRVYPVADEADKISCRPDFAISFFPGHMTFHTKNKYELNSLLPVNNKTPPTFLLQAGNDPVDTIQHSLVYYIALKKANVPVEYHIYAEGGHAFGYKKTSRPKEEWKEWNKLPIAEWPVLLERWLRTIKVISSD